MQNTFDDQLEIFFLEATPTIARVCVRLSRGNWPAAARLRGVMSGPTCDFAETLPTVHSFVDRSQVETLCAEAIVPDPSYWTTELPHFYDLRIELCQGDNVVATHATQLGLRASNVRLAP